MGKKKNTKAKKEAKENRAKKLSELKDFVTGLIDLIVVFAQASASYVLYFQGTQYLKIVAVIIALRALATASARFTNK